MKSRALALITVALLAACSQRSEQDLLSSAQKRLDQRDVSGAVIELKNLLQQSPDSAKARQLLGKALLDSGDMAGAEIELRRAWELGAPRDELAPMLAQALLQSGQPRKVVGEFGDQSLADPAAMASLQRSLAMAYLVQGNAAQAKGAATRALQLQPDAEDSVVVDARVKLANGGADDALAALDKYLAQQPKAAKAAQLKAEVLIGRRKVDEAEPLLRQVLAQDPQSFDARALLLRLALAEKKVDVAAQLVDEMPADAAKKPQGRFLQAQVALAKGDAAKARELALPLLKVMPNYLPLLRLASGAHQQLGELADAENLLNQAVKVAPEDLALRRQYAGLQLQRREPAKVLETLRPVLEVAKGDAESHLLAGKAHLLLGNFEAADQAFSLAAKLRPEDTKASAALALSAIARDGLASTSGSRAKADAALNQLRDIAAKDPAGTYDLMVVNALLRRGDLNGAMAAIDKLAPKMAGSPVPDSLRGRVQLARKDTAGAKAAFEAALKADAGYLPAALGLVGLDVQAGKPDDGVKRLEAFVAAQPRVPQARLALAELMSQTRAPADRITEVLAAGVRAEPTDVGLRLALIDSHLRAGNAAKAGQAAQEAIAALPQNPELVERLARTQVLADDKAQAAKTYTQLTVLAPKRAQGWLGLAQLRVAEGDFAGGEREVKRALEAEPDSVAAQRLAIQLTLRQGRTEQGLAALRERQKANPQEAFAWIAEADVEAGRQRYDAAVTALRKATALPDPAEAAPRLFAVLMAAKKRDEALAFETQWTASHPQDLLFQGAAADTLLARGDLEGALTRYEALLKRTPDALQVLNNVAWLRSKLGKGGALELVDRGLKLAADYGPLRDTYATVLANEKQFAKALTVQRQLITDQPDQPAYRVNLAEILIQSGDKAAARTELESLAKQGNKVPQQAQVQALLKSLGG